MKIRKSLIVIAAGIVAMVAWKFYPVHRPADGAYVNTAKREKVELVKGISTTNNSPADVAYINKVKREMINLAKDPVTTNKRVAKIKTKTRDGWWTDGRVGVTADGYVFYYDLHESHGMDAISDIHMLYLPDEHRFLITRDHFCCDLSKFQQAKNKREVVSYFN